MEKLVRDMRLYIENADAKGKEVEYARVEFGDTEKVADHLVWRCPGTMPI